MTSLIYSERHSQRIDLLEKHRFGNFPNHSMLIQVSFSDSAFACPLTVSHQLRNAKIISSLKSGMLAYGVIASAAIALTPFSAFAGSNIYDNTFSGCTGENCSSLVIPGTIFISGGVGAASFDINVYAAPNECLRLDVVSVSPVADLETTVIAPNGSVYRNDDGFGGGVFNNPLVKVAAVPNNGWYTVHISQWAGVAVNTNFTLHYGRYPAGNPNCAGGTVPVSAPLSPSNAKPEAALAPSGYRPPGS